MPDQTLADAYDSMLLALKEDREEGFTHYLGFYRAPAAKGNHHDYEGGLVAHLLEMWEVWCWSHHLTEAMDGEHVSHSRVLRAIINHDLHKSFCTYVLMSADPWAVEYGKHETDMLMTKEVKTMWMLGDFRIPMDPEQYNALCWAEGGFSPIQPKWTSILAKIVYLVDETSGNVLARAEKRTYLDLRKPVACASDSLVPGARANPPSPTSSPPLSSSPSFKGSAEEFLLNLDSPKSNNGA